MNLPYTKHNHLHSLISNNELNNVMRFYLKYKDELLSKPQDCFEAMILCEDEDEAAYIYSNYDVICDLSGITASILEKEENKHKRLILKHLYIKYDGPSLSTIKKWMDKFYCTETTDKHMIAIKNHIFVYNTHINYVYLIANKRPRTYEKMIEIMSDIVTYQNKVHVVPKHVSEKNFWYNANTFKTNWQQSKLSHGCPFMLKECAKYGNKEFMEFLFSIPNNCIEDKDIKEAFDLCEDDKMKEYLLTLN